MHDAVVFVLKVGVAICELIFDTPIAPLLVVVLSNIWVWTKISGPEVKGSISVDSI